jgi:GNAT superfamily N-acetyltransferase
VRWFTWREAIGIAEPGLEGVLRAAQPGTPTIRPATVADAPHCARVYRRSKSFAMPEVPEPHSEAEVATWMADGAIPTMDVWVAEVDGVVVGQMMLDRIEGDGWLQHLYVDPSWMGRGLGDQFMALARERHPDGLQLWAFQSNASARRFYERHGFVATEFTDGTGNEERWPDVRYAG